VSPELGVELRDPGGQFGERGARRRPTLATELARINVAAMDAAEVAPVRERAAEGNILARG